MTDIAEIDLLELPEFIIESKKERERYFIQVNKERIFVNLAIYDSSKSLSYVKFNSYIFLDDEESIKVEFLANDFNERKFEDAIVVGIFNLGGVKFIFESEIESWDKNGNSFEVSLLHPRRMIRYQRRDAFRINVPQKYDVKLDLFDGNVNLKNLRVTNISLLGAAIHINTDEKFFQEHIEFKGAKLHLNFNNKKQYFNVDIRICRKRELKELNKGNERGIWYEVGVKFENILPRMEQEISVLVNDIARKL